MRAFVTRKLADLPWLSDILGAVEELLAALVEDPDDLGSWSVYADALQTRGDPRGELISMMLRREQEPTPQLFEAQRRYLARHAATLAPETAQVWRRGFLTELRIASPEQLAVLAEPPLRFVDAVTRGELATVYTIRHLHDADTADITDR
jgi:uncharacterized protein (TIGR02996 family)